MPTAVEYSFDKFALNTANLSAGGGSGAGPFVGSQAHGSGGGAGLTPDVLEGLLPAVQHGQSGTGASGGGGGAGFTPDLNLLLPAVQVYAGAHGAGGGGGAGFTPDMNVLLPAVQHSFGTDTGALVPAV